MKKTLTKKEFVKLIVAEVKNNLKPKEAIIESNNISESIDNSKVDEVIEPESTFKAEDIVKLAEEIKKINKRLSFENPVIFQEDNSLIDKIIKEGKSDKREPDLDGINKNKEVYHKGESEEDKWKRMMNYSVPKDNER